MHKTTIYLLLIFILATIKLHSQSNLPCTSPDASNVLYPNASSAIAALPTNCTNYSPNISGVTITDCYIVTSSSTGTIGVVQMFSNSGPSWCDANIANSRTAALSLPGCGNPAIPINVANGGNSSSFNPEWNQLCASTDYMICITTTIPSSCPYSRGCPVFYNAPGGSASAMTVTATNTSDCSGACNGSAIASVSGGASPYNFAWSTGGLLIDETGMCAGTHYVIVTDNASCTDSASVIINSPFASVSDSICFGDSILIGGIWRSTTGIYYDTTIVIGCDSVTEINLSVFPISSDTVNIGYCEGDIFVHILPDGNAVYGAGIFIDTIPSIANCDSIITTIIVENPTYNDTIQDGICNGATYILPDGSTTTTVGIYTFNYTTINTCDSIYNVNLTADSLYTDSAEIVICQGDFYTFNNGDTTLVPGSYIDTLPSASSCDTVLYMDLLVANTTDIEATASFCAPHNYPLPDGNVVDSTGVYLTTLYSIHGCEFQLTTNLFIYEPAFDTSYHEICDNEEFIHVTYNLPLGNPAIWERDTTNIAGVYTDTLFINRGGIICDSFHTSYLTVNPTYDSLYYEVICDNDSLQLIDGSYVYTQGNHTVMYQTILSCDSAIRVNLTVNPTFDSTYVVSICDNDSLLMPDGSYQNTAGIYTFNDTTTYGCDSIYRVDLSLNPTYNTPIDITICDNDYHILPLGDTARNEGLYLDTLTTILGCDSVISTTVLHDSTYSDTIQVDICDNQTHTLQNGAIVSTTGYYPVILSTVDGCDSLVTTNLTVNPTYNTVIDTSICQDETYLLPNGFTVFFPGSFPVMLQAVTGCDSLVVTNLAVTPTQFTTIDAEICDNETYTLPDGQIVNTSGTFVDTLQTLEAGCDSVVTTNLTVNPTYTTVINAEICDNEIYTLPLGTIVDTANTYYDTLTTVSSCDSLIVTNLTINPTYSDTIYSTICDNETYTLPSGMIVNTTNIYIDTLNSISSCDSIITTILTVNTTFHTIINDTICNNEFYIRPLGDTVYLAGQYLDTLSTIFSCDSVIETNITVFPVGYDTVNIDYCEGDVFTHTLPSGTVVSSAGIFTDTISTVNGCDSITTTFITENPIYNDTIQGGICDSELYTLPDGSTTNIGGIYTYNYSTIHTCDSIFSVELFVSQTYLDTILDTICDNQTYTLPLGNVVNMAGTYLDTLQSVLFCDSVIVTELFINPTFTDTIQASICNNETHTLQDGSLVNTAGFHPVTLNSILACDSVVYTELTVYPTFNTPVEIEICDNEYHLRPLGDTVRTPGVYTDTLNTINLCDSVITTTVIVHPSYVDTFNYTICDNESFTMPDLSQVTSAGIYPYSLNSTESCDSTVYIVISVNPTYSDTVYAEICDNQTYTLPNGFVVSTANTYPVTLQSALLCDSVVTTILSMNPTYSDTVFIDICDNETHTLPDGNIVNTLGNYLVMYNSSLNCDSAFYTNITVYPTYNDTIYPEICDNETYTLPDASVVNTAGFFTFNYSSINTCDSIFNINLSINPTYQDTVNVEICDNEIHILPDGVLANTAGTYSSTINSISMCDSVVVTHLLVHPTYSDTLYHTICDNELHTLPNGFQTNTAGYHPVILQSINLCDSVVTTHLTVNPTFNTPLNIDICDNEFYIMPLGDTITSTGVFIDTLSSILSCDSFITVTVTVYPTFATPLFIDICDNEWHYLPDGDSANTSGVYIDTLASIWACDSVITTALFVHPTYSDTITVEICDNETHTLQNGSIINIADYYPVILNTGEGCDSVVTTNLIVHPTYSDTLNITICDNQTHTLPNGFVVSTAGQYPVMLQTIELCDSLVVTNLTVVPTFITNISVEICDNETYTTPLGNIVDTTGIYYDTLSTVTACDSVIVTDLLVHPTYNTLITIEICDNEFYIRPLGDTATTAGVYTDTLSSINSCDSVVTTTLIVHPTFNTPIFVEICDNEFYTRPLGSTENTSGVYTDTLSSIYGCDSVITTNLTVHPTYNTPITIEICDNEFYVRPLGDTITIAGIYTDTLQTINMCDSVITTTLIVHPTYALTLDFIICDNEWHHLPDGDSTNTAGTYIDTLYTIYGCDSVITTNITVLPTFAITYDIDICQGETYTLLDGTIVNSTGSYDVIMTAGNGCNSTVTTNLTVNPIYNDTVQAIICDNEIFTLANGVQVNTTGFYTVNIFSINGCDSIVTVDLMVNTTFSDTINDTICDNETYTLPDGNIVNIAGTYTSIFSSVLTCDSIIITNLIVNTTYDTSINVYDCGPSYLLPSGAMVSATGVYVVNLQTQFGCDSIVTIDLEMFDYDPNLDIYICDNETYTLPDGTIIGSAGIYSVPLMSINGCDSTMNYNIIEYQSYDDTIDVEICDNQTYTLPNGWAVNLANNYTFNYSTINGCDSLYTINLIVNPTYTTTVNDTICVGNSYTLPDGVLVNTTGIYNTMLSSVSTCDSLIITNLYHYPDLNDTVNIDLCNGETYMLSNGSFVNTAGIYTVPYIAINSCDSNITTIISIIPTFANTINDTICDNEDYILPLGNVVSISGIYLDTLQAINGCDSVVTTNLTVNPTYNDTINITICANETHTLQNGMVVNLAAYYEVNMNTINGCDSIVTTNLIVSPVITTLINDTICDNQTYTLPNGNIVNLTGVYTDTLMSSTACDSIIQTELIVNPTYTTNIDAEICENETFTLADGSIVNTSGIYSTTLQSVSSCDSVINVNLTVNSIYSDTIVINRCDNENYVLADGTVVNITGFYSVTLNSVNGCDSILTIDLRVHATFEDTTNIVICADDSIILEDGTVVNTSGNYIIAFNTINGCDSIYYTNLIVNPVYGFSQDAFICDNETYTLPDGVIVNTAGIYSSTLSSINSCDSIITTNLTVYSTSVDTVDITICDNETYILLDGTIVNTTGTYSVTLNSVNGCDSVVTTDLTVLPTYRDSVYQEICYDDYYTLPNGWQMNISGTYEVVLTAQNGCDSTIITELLVHNFTNITEAIEDVEMCLGELETITVDYDGYNYIWNDGTTGPTINPTSSDVYIVEFNLNGNNCIARDTIRVRVKDCAETCLIDIPTAFSPNELGYNNIFRVIHTCDDGFDKFEFRIYNRWGHLVFLTNEPAEGWNGFYKGKEAPIAVYSYVVEYKKTGSTEAGLLKGNVTLIR